MKNIINADRDSEHVLMSLDLLARASAKMIVEAGLAHSLEAVVDARFPSIPPRLTGVLLRLDDIYRRGDPAQQAAIVSMLESLISELDKYILSQNSPKES